MLGTVKWYNPEKGYGFLTGQDGLEYFCHKSEVEGGLDDLLEGVDVEFQPVKAERGLKATKVLVVVAQ
jgi:CspA family cold shock protein